MTPTRDQLDAVLTRSSAGVSAMTGDLGDPEERARALDWLEKTIREAVSVRQEFRFSDSGFMALTDRVFTTPLGKEVTITRDELDLALRFNTGRITRAEALAQAADGRLTIYGRRVRLADSAPESPRSDAEPPDRVRTPETLSGAHSGSWGPPDPTLRAMAHCMHWIADYSAEACCQCDRVIGDCALEYSMAWCRPWLKITARTPDDRSNT